MQIDWFTFVAQLINFVVLVYLLKRALYGPILQAMDQREERIAARLNEAREKEAEARQEAERYRSMQQELNSKRQQHLSEAETEAAARREELIQQAREEVQRLESEWRDGLARDRETFMRELSERALSETVAIARRALDDLAGADLEARVIEVFIRQLQTLDPAKQAELSEALRTAGGAITVRSAFEQIRAYRERLQEVLSARLGQDVTVTVDVEPAIGFGVELRIADRKVAWSLDSYLAQLTDTVRERLDTELRRGQEAIPTSSPQEVET